MENNTVTIDDKIYPTALLKDEDIVKDTWILDSDNIPFMIVQVMNSQADPYMMIRALDGKKLKLVNSEDYHLYKKIIKEN